MLVSPKGKLVLPIVEVTWYDARFRGKNDPVSVARNDTGYTRRTVGYVVREDDDEIVLAMTFDGEQDAGEEAEVDDRLTIPMGMVRHIAPLKFSVARVDRDAVGPEAE